MTPNFVYHLTDPRLPAGRDGIKALGQVIVAAVQDLIADGDRVIERI
jgi:hypothetical protein